MCGGELDFSTDVPERIMGILIIYQISNESVKAKGTRGLLVFTVQFCTALLGIPCVRGTKGYKGE